jgi:hypothetical protein
MLIYRIEKADEVDIPDIPVFNFFDRIRIPN